MTNNELNANALLADSKRALEEAKRLVGSSSESTIVRANAWVQISFAATYLATASLANEAIADARREMGPQDR